MTTLKQTPSQTVGPYFAYGLCPEQYNFDLKSLFTPSIADREAAGEHVSIVGNVYDGQGKVVGDAVIEMAQADSTGHYVQSVAEARESGFRGFARVYGQKFPADLRTEVADGYAVMFHDAVQTLVRAAQTAVDPAATTPAAPSTDRVRQRLKNLNGPSAVDGATGTLSFSAAHGGRAGNKEVPVLRTVPGGADAPVAGDVYLTPTD